jgi:amidase
LAQAFTERSRAVWSSLSEKSEGFWALRRAIFCDEQQVFRGSDRDEVDLSAIPIVCETLIAGMEDSVVGVVRIEPGLQQRDLPRGKEPRGELNAEQAKVMAEAIAVLKQQGAIVVDPADLPSVISSDPKGNTLLWNTCAGLDGAKGRDADCSVVFKYGMKRDFNKWLASLGPAAPVKSLTELRYWNLAHTKAGTLKYGQSQLDISDEMDVDADRARYQIDRAKDIALSGPHGIDEVMRVEQLDALLFPGGSGALLSSRPGYPTVIVPFGTVANGPSASFPRGFDARPSPFGVSFAGSACSEPRLIALAYAFEQATRRRVPPPGRRTPNSFGVGASHGEACKAARASEIPCCHRTSIEERLNS